MNDLTGNTPSEMLHLLLDGELSTMQEVPLYSELASNDDLRSEMRDMLTIRNTVNRDDEAFTPPIAATMAVFSNAGFSAPIVTGFATAARTGFFSGLVKNLWLPVLLAGISALVTYYFTSESYNSQLAKIHNNNYPSVVSSAKPDNTPNTISSVPKEKIVYKYIYKSIPAEQNKNIELKNQDLSVNVADTKLFSETNNNENFFQQKLKYSEITTNDAMSKFSLNTNHANFPSGKFAINNRFLNSGKPGNDYTVTIRGLSGLTFPDVSTSPDGSNMLTNVGLGVYFLNLYKNLKIGFEAGNEPFTQSFINIENNKKWLKIQKPCLWWGGLGLWGGLDKIDALYGAKPFAKVLISISEIGPLGKLVTGFEWAPEYSGIGMFCGLEGSYLAYQNQHIWYNSQKLGLTYGLSIHF